MCHTYTDTQTQTHTKTQAQAQAQTQTQTHHITRQHYLCLTLSTKSSSEKVRFGLDVFETNSQLHLPKTK
jgi:hypothetical protein